MEDVTFNQIMDEIDQKNKAVEKLKSPFDTESEIKVIKRFQPSQSDDDAQITFLGTEPYNQTKSTNGDFESDLCFMLDDDLVSLTGFETFDSADDKSKEGTGETFYASADMPAQSDPLGHLHEELRILNNKIDQLESSITKKVTDDIQSSVPSIVCYPSAGTEQSHQNQSGVSVKNKGEQQSGVDTMANTQGEQPPTQELMNVEQAPHVNEENALVLHASVEKSSEENTSEKIIEPTPPRDESKEKGIATEEPLKDLMPYIEEGAYVPKMPKIKSFITRDEQLTQEDITAQVKEMKRLDDLKAEKEKLDESLKMIMNPTNIKARAQKIAEYEAKRAKMFKEYNDCINQRANELPIMKISYRVSSSNDATMRITRGNDPLNVVVHDKFRLKTLGFNNKKWKQTSELIKEVFAKENVVVDGMHRNLAPPPGVEGRRALVIHEPEAGIFYYNGNFDLVFQRESEFHLATTIQLVRLQNAIIRDSLEAEEMYKLMELEIKSMSDVTKVREIVKDNLDGMGQHM
ncbi:hypothetical protein Tco_0705626 [Tanacetum coccineum]|uniref:Uncharacterized protein n=1 Tax=Tanacetum coccineum TaxID=301880 RepID=A0ABQ4Y606_9ASTR